MIININNNEISIRGHMDNSGYPFRILKQYHEEPLKDPKILFKRPFTKTGTSFADEARFFIPEENLLAATNTAIAVGSPILLTGEPGTGKTQAAYYAAYKLGIEPVIHFQVKSDSTAKNLLYHFDAVRYFHDANLKKGSEQLKKSNYIEQRALWVAMTSEFPRIILIDEIDKAPRDFPNDLLHELDRMEFTVIETGEMVSSGTEKRPIVFITSNSERRLPEPFLRRCVYHHIEFNDALLVKAVEIRKHYYDNLSNDFIQMAMQRFLALRDISLRKIPSTSEFLVWLRVLALTIHTRPEKLESDLSRLPYLGMLLKDHQDLMAIREGMRF